jgi:hypothetical protein
MAHDERRRERGEAEPEWRGDEGFGGGWGNQVPRPHRRVDPDFAPPRGYNEGGDWYDPGTARGGYVYGEPGADTGYGGPRRAEFGRAGGTGHGLGAGAMFGSSARDFALRGEARHDPHYAEWRDRRIAEFDSDYDEYRRENQSRFDREFSDWRQRRGEQRAAIGRVREHMEVTGSDGGHVGKVDCTRGDRIILTKSDEAAGGVHHSIPCAWIGSVDDKVVLDIEAEEARRRWQTENRSRALFEREDSGQRGPRVLNRSFAGTYSDEQ